MEKAASAGSCEDGELSALHTLKMPCKTRGMMTVRAEPFWRESQWLHLGYLYVSNSQPVKQCSPPSEREKDFKMSKHTDLGGKYKYRGQGKLKGRIRGAAER